MIGEGEGWAGNQKKEEKGNQPVRRRCLRCLRRWRRAVDGDGEYQILKENRI
jgi:hypothetical protein